MKIYKISTKIKLIVSMFIVSMFTVIVSTIYLNQKNIKDSLKINIAGKQRMLTQKISKNIFYSYSLKKLDLSELDKAVVEFKTGLDTLKYGNKLLGISKAPTIDINEQILKVEILWRNFEKHINEFKTINFNDNIQINSSSVLYIYNTNNELLNEVDILVSMFTKYSEEKTDFIKKFQYIAMAILFYLSIYSILQLREIENHAKIFMDQSKQIANTEATIYKPINIKGESEIVEVADNLNCFINKLNSAMQYSNEAIDKAKNASNKLEELTDEFDNIIGEIENSSSILSKLDRSEDMALDSTESLLSTTKKLQNLKLELDGLLTSCKESVKKKI